MALRSIIFPRIYTYLLERRDPRVSKLILEILTSTGSFGFTRKIFVILIGQKILREKLLRQLKNDWNCCCCSLDISNIEISRNLFFILVLLFLEMSSIRYYVWWLKIGGIFRPFVGWYMWFCCVFWHNVLDIWIIWKKSILYTIFLLHQASKWKYKTNFVYNKCSTIGILKIPEFFLWSL